MNGTCRVRVGASGFKKCAIPIFHGCFMLFFSKRAFLLEENLQRIALCFILLASLASHILIWLYPFREMECVCGLIDIHL